MVGDREGHYSFPSRTHLCYAGEPAHVGLRFQAGYCLGGQFPDCARFQRAEGLAPAATAASAAIAAPAATTEPATAEPAATAQPAAADPRGTAEPTSPEPTASGQPAGAFAAPATASVPPAIATYATRRRDGGRSLASTVVAVLLALALLTAVLAFAFATGIIMPPGGGGPVTGVATPTAPATAGMTATIAPTDQATVAPTGAPTSAPTQAPATEAPTTGPTPSDGQVLHVVEAGETLFGIAARYGVSVEAIVAANGIVNPDLIQPGDTLIIPLAGAASPTPVESPGETIHVVQPGETLSVIAARYGVTVQAIQEANSITDPNRIFVGQRLVIPTP